MVADLGGAFAAAGPVAAGVVLARGERRAVGLGAGEDVVHVRRVATPLDRRPLLIQGGVLVQLVVAVQLRDRLGDDHALGVLPGPRADTVAGVDRRSPVAGAGAEVGAPGALAGPGGGGELLAMRVGTGQAAEVGALARALAGDEEGHVGLLGLAGETAGQGQQRRGQGEGESQRVHVQSSCGKRSPQTGIWLTP
ncbi:hypothetical protein D9M68_813920 [compost metagenome]